MIRQRIRIRFTKQGDLRQLGHMDLARTLERLLRRAGIPLSMTEGFHPRSRVSFPLALAVGIASTDEVAEFDIAEERSIDQLQATLTEHEIPGLHFTSIELVPEGQKKARVESVEFTQPVPADRRDEIWGRVTEFLAADHRWHLRPGRRAPIDVRGDVLSIEQDFSAEDGDVLRIRVAIQQEVTSRPREILAELGLEDLEQQGYFLTRTAVHLREPIITHITTKRMNETRITQHESQLNHEMSKHE